MKLRGSKEVSLNSIADTMELALKSAPNEKKLRDYMKSIIKHIRSKQTEGKTQ